MREVIFHPDYGVTASATPDPVGPKFLRITDIGKPSIDWNRVPHCRCSDREQEEKQLRSGDLVVARIGATTGITYLYRSNDAPAVFASYLIRIRCMETLNPDFLYQFSQSPLYWSQVDAIKQGRLKEGINTEELKNLAIPFPPFPEQQRIATVLGIVDEAIAATDGVIKNLEAVREAIGRKLFTQGICHTDFVKTRLGSYPRAWNLKPLGEIADIGSGTALGRKLSGPLVRLPYLRVANVQDGYLDLSEIKYIDILESEREKWLLEVGDILLTEGGDWDKLGRGTIWNGEIENCIHQNHIFRVRLTDPAFDVRFVHYLLSSFYGKAYFKQASKQSTNLASINQKQLRSFVVLQPPLGEQRRIAATLSAFDDRLALERAERDRLVALKKGLMQVLLTGKVRVPPGVAEGVAPAHA